MRIDELGRLFIAGAYNGDGWVTDSRTGEILKKYKFSDDPAAVTPDVTVTHDAAYFTDAYLGQIYKVKFGPNGELPDEAEVLKVSGDGISPELLLGITAAPDGTGLLISSVRQGKLYRVDSNTGAATEVDLGGASIPGMDGMVLDGTTLYATRVRQGTVVRIDLDTTATTGHLVSEVTDPNFENPAALAVHGDRLYVTSTREIVVPEPGPTTNFWITSIPKP